MKTGKMLLLSLLTVLAMLCTACSAAEETQVPDSTSLQEALQQRQEAAAAEPEAEKEEESAPTKPTSTPHQRPTQVPEQAIDYETIYAQIIAHASDLLSNGDGAETGAGGETGLLEAKITGKGAGYAIQDLSGDGIPELMLCAATKQTAAGYTGSEIYALYTCKGETPVLVFEGWSRSRYQLIEGNSFFYEGSNGAMSSIFGVFGLSEDGSELVCDEYYFSDAKDENFNIGYYHNFIGEYNKQTSDELTITGSEFWEICDELSQPVQELELTLLPGSNGAVTDVTVAYADEVSVAEGEYDTVVVTDSQWSTKVFVMAEDSVSDFKVLSLTLEDVADDGTITFATQTLHEQDVLSREKPLLLQLNLESTIPCCGISFVDAAGALHQFAITMSGEDGSVCLQQF